MRAEVINIEAIKEEPMSIEKLTAEQIAASLKELPGWELKDGKLHRQLKLKNFVQAFGFMTQVAILAEQMDHHAG
jgi:4a-hydroxytetrahydrobiopterin dehydratase